MDSEINERRQEYSKVSRTRKMIPCDGCVKIRNCINGRWCTQLRIYVEHLTPAQGRPCLVGGKGLG